MREWIKLNQTIIECERCPRLRAHARAIAIEKRRAFATETYWGRPAPNFGAENAQLAVLGLAPAAHDANRTGRMFTGDRSGEWLYRALYKAGFASKPASVAANDDLELIGCAITAAIHCAPPQNRPLPSEIDNCAPYLSATFDLLPARVIVALGAIAWTQALREAKRRGWMLESTVAERKTKHRFRHLAELEFSEGRRMLGSYHPSQQNTFTGKLTEPMFDAVFARAKSLLDITPAQSF